VFIDAVGDIKDSLLASQELVIEYIKIIHLQTFLRQDMLSAKREIQKVVWKKKKKRKLCGSSEYRDTFLLKELEISLET
jgi:hypothetical protein